MLSIQVNGDGGAEIAALKKELAALKTEVGDLKSSLKEKSGEVEGLQKENEELKGKLKSCQEEVIKSHTHTSPHNNPSILFSHSLPPL